MHTKKVSRASCPDSLRHAYYDLCKGEGFATISVLEQFSLYIHALENVTIHFTNNQPDAWKRAKKGLAHLSTFLIALTDLPIKIRHKAGAQMFTSDFISSHQQQCPEILALYLRLWAAADGRQLRVHQTGHSWGSHVGQGQNAAEQFKKITRSTSSWVFIGQTLSPKKQRATITSSSCYTICSKKGTSKWKKTVWCWWRSSQKGKPYGQPVFQQECSLLS